MITLSLEVGICIFMIVLIELLLGSFFASSVHCSEEKKGSTDARPSSFAEAPKEHIESIGSGAHTYTIEMGGTLDGFNTVYYPVTYDGFRREESKFEPNEYVIIENTGKVDVVNPRIVINGRRNWFSADDILASVLKPGMTDFEKAMAIFGFTSSIELQCHENNRRVGPPYPDDRSNPSRNMFKERANPVKAANCYYCSGCSLSAANFVVLCRHAGLMARAVWMSPLEAYKIHCAAEVWYDGGWHLLDPERRSFYLDSDNTTIASYETLHKNPELEGRTHNGGFASSGLKSHFSDYKAYYPPHVMPVEQWLSTMAMSLRPGEKFVWRWDHLNKYRYGGNPRNRCQPPYRFANGKMIYQPDLTEHTFRRGISSELNVRMADEERKLPRVHPEVTGASGFIMYKVKTAYPIVGGIVGGKFYRKTEDDACGIYVSIADSDWIQVWSAKGTGDIESYSAIDEIIDPKPNPARYEYYVKYEFRAGHGPADAGLNEVYIETDVQMSSAALPSLSVGLNEVVYKDDTANPHSVRVTHGWKESLESTPPMPPARPVSPADGARIEIRSLKKMVWEAVRCSDGEAIADYHIRVSPREDMLYPVSPNFDRITSSPNPEWDVPEGWLMQGKTYFWRVRARNEWGAWSPWSEVWSFEVHNL